MSVGQMKRKSRARAITGIAIAGALAGLFWSRKISRTRESVPARMDIRRASLPRTQESTSRKIIEPLTLAELGQRIGDVYREGYLTVLAIIQGVALGILLSNAEGQWVHHADTIYRVKVATQAVSVLVAIIIVTHRYILLTVIGRWIPTTFDTIIPYALGVGEIGASLTTGSNRSWWTSVAVFSLAGVSSFVHSRFRMSAADFGEVPQLYIRFRRITSVAIISLSLLATASVVMVALSTRGIGPEWLYSLAPVLFLIATLAVELAGSYHISKLK